MAQDPPRDALRRGRSEMQTPTEFGWRFITLGVITPGAGRDYVLPLVTAAPAAWQHMVDGLRSGAAVDAPPAIAGEYRASGQADVRPVWNPNKSGQTHDERNRERGALAVQDPFAIGDADSFRGEDQNGCPAD